MSTLGLLLVALVMAVGLVGVVVPVLPGLALIWAAGLVWALAEGSGAGRWVTLAVMTVLLVAGTVAKFVLPGRSVLATGAPRSTLLAGGAGALVGFFVIPVVGLVVGGALGVLLAESRRLGDTSRAWTSTRGVLLGVGIGVLLELVAGVAMVVAWVVGVAAT